MKKCVELPLIKPIYSTYHNQGTGSSIIVNNPSIINWYLNNCIILKCNRRFLKGYSSPQVNILQTSWYENPYINRIWISTEFLNGYINSIIRKMLNEGYYLSFGMVDDYYVEGKSMYGERHFSHDGCICGYNQEDKTYCLFSYDKDWIYKKFWTAQSSFYKGVKSMRKQGKYTSLYALKPKMEHVELQPIVIIENIRKYLNSTKRQYPLSKDGDVFGVVVHDYIAMYVDKIYDGSIPYESIDKRVFRLIWEHKKVMLDRISAVEDVLNINKDISNLYKDIVIEADIIRMLYASHNIRKRDEVLPIIREKLMQIKKTEIKLLNDFIRKAEIEINQQRM